MVVAKVNRVREQCVADLANTYKCRFQVNIRVVTRKDSLEKEVQKTIQVTEQDYGVDYELHQIAENRRKMVEGMKRGL